MSLNNSASDGKLTLELMKNSVLNKEARRKEKGNNLSSSSDAYVAENKDESRGRSQIKMQHGSSKSRGRSQSCPRTNIVFYHCSNKEGHKRSL